MQANPTQEAQIGGGVAYFVAIAVFFEGGVAGVMVFVFDTPVLTYDLEGLPIFQVFVAQVVPAVNAFLASLFIFFFVSAFVDALYAGKR